MTLRRQKALQLTMLKCRKALQLTNLVAPLILEDEWGGLNPGLTIRPGSENHK
jgi:hypothetical protein